MYKNIIKKIKKEEAYYNPKGKFQIQEEIRTSIANCI